MGVDHKPSYDELIDLVRDLRGELAALKAERDELKARVTDLEGKLAAATKTSRNSSKPPSSDIVKQGAEGGRRRGKRKTGGQPGHQKHERTFELSDADQQHGYELGECPNGGEGRLILLPEETKIVYQYELVEKPVLLHAHLAFGYWCTECEKIHHAELPAEVRKGGLVGERLTSLIGFLKGACHSSFSVIRALLEDAWGVTLSEGMTIKVAQKISQALAIPYQQLLERLPLEPTLNIDETGHKDNGKPWWNWCFRAKDFTLFQIANSRGSAVLESVLGKECEAVIGSDHFGAYRKYMKKAPVTVQFCLAHLIRELRFLAESPSKPIAAYGQRLLRMIKRFFRLIHHRDRMPPELFRKRLERASIRFLRMARRTQAGGEAATLAARFRTYGEEYFTFISRPDIDPTNNVAERAIRFCVIDRKITQGTRGAKGQRWSERIWTVMATCAQQGRSAFAYMTDAVHAFFSKAEAPSLLPT
jgi:transposase